jgi:hypothetical protein
MSGVSSPRVQIYRFGVVTVPNHLPTHSQEHSTNAAPMGTRGGGQARQGATGGSLGHRFAVRVDLGETLRRLRGAKPLRGSPARHCSNCTGSRNRARSPIATQEQTGIGDQIRVVESHRDLVSQKVPGLGEQ